MIVRIRWSKGGDRFEDVMNVNNREEAIQEAIYNFVANKGFFKSSELVECEGESIEDFYEMEEKNGGYDSFWDMEQTK